MSEPGDTLPAVPAFDDTGTIYAGEADMDTMGGRMSRAREAAAGLLRLALEPPRALSESSFLTRIEQCELTLLRYFALIAALTPPLPTSRNVSLHACDLCRSYTQSLERRSKALATGRDAAQTPPRAPKLPRAHSWK